MPTWLIVLIIVVAVAILLYVAWVTVRRRRTDRLRGQFGPEYERTVAERGDARAAESDLEARRRRREQLDIRPLTPSARARYADAWHAAQTRFVDTPNEAVREADVLVMEVMRERGYPTDDFEQRAADVSVDHPNLVSNYRKAHTIAQASADGSATTEDLRRAMVHYRSLFEELLEGGDEPRRTAEVT